MLRVLQEIGARIYSDDPDYTNVVMPFGLVYWISPDELSYEIELPGYSGKVLIIGEDGIYLVDA